MISTHTANNRHGVKKNLPYEVLLHPFVRCQCPAFRIKNTCAHSAAVAQLEHRLPELCSKAIKFAQIQEVKLKTQTVVLVGNPHKTKYRKSICR